MVQQQAAAAARGLHGMQNFLQYCIHVMPNAVTKIQAHARARRARQRVAKGHSVSTGKEHVKKAIHKRGRHLVPISTIVACMALAR